MSALPSADAGPTFAIVTLGCARNEVDSDQLAGLLARDGYRFVEDPVGADVVLVNTCTFITPATEESVDTVLAACDLKRDATRAVVVVGCMAERYREELAAAVPEADAVVGFGAYPRLPSIVGDLLAGRLAPRFQGSRPASVGHALPLHPVGGGSRRGYLEQDVLDRIPPTGPRFDPPRTSAAARPWAYLKIASGCDRTCTFCAIPSWRGRFRSRPLDEILREAASLVARGTRELVLVSENTTSWGKDLDGGRDLQPRLLESLCELEGLHRVRLMYLQPAELRRPLLEAIATLPRVASYFDLSLQHVASDLLRGMSRRGSPERFRQLVDDIRQLDPRAVLRSNFIVGFPGETDEHVAQLADFLTDARLDWVGLFAFSPQEGTAAPQMPGQVPDEVAAQRLHALADLQEEVADDRARTFVGRRLEVTVQTVDDDGCVARSYREAPDTDGEIRLLAQDGMTPARLAVGRTVTAEVVDAEGVDLVAIHDGRG
ncbi:MAG TPA: 30S ribosomal protein S12 methylthiotransferase RimO [Nitriliruptorales bacterium]|nr:30S ribosomal protein S12 methylthiotransferase RimO [Nitriliruptorales bacterium]